MKAYQSKFVVFPKQNIERRETSPLENILLGLKCLIPKYAKRYIKQQKEAERHKKTPSEHFESDVETALNDFDQEGYELISQTRMPKGILLTVKKKTTRSRAPSTKTTKK